MREAVVFLVGFATSFALICGGSVLFEYALDGTAAFFGGFLIGAVAAGIVANN